MAHRSQPLDDSPRLGQVHSPTPCEATFEEEEESEVTQSSRHDIKTNPKTTMSGWLASLIIDERFMRPLVVFGGSPFPHGMEDEEICWQNVHFAFLPSSLMELTWC
jgi:hypothetical protein